MAEVLIVSNPSGSSAREHALAWKLSQSPEVKNVWLAPGNAGYKNSLPDLTTPEDFLRFAKDKKIDLTVVGPEALLAEGIVDMFEAEKLKIFGPRQHVAKLETSKIWCYKKSVEWGVPFAPSWTFLNRQQELAKQKVREVGFPVVLKVYGLADGKGVTIHETENTAFQEIDDIMAGKYPNGGKDLLIQMHLQGKELSVFTLSDGQTILTIPKTFRDYKWLNGLTTGGVGGFGPVSITRSLLNQIEEQITKPTISGLKDEGGFKGVLYTGIMLTDEGPKEFEQNVRWGDPECELLMPLISSDLYPVLYSCTNGTLSSQTLNYFYGFTAGVVLCAEGYPAKPVGKDEIFGLNKTYDQDVNIFHYQTRKRPDGKIETHGGREVVVVGYDPNSIKGSREKVYGEINSGIYFRGMQKRDDIGS